MRRLDGGPLTRQKRRGNAGLEFALMLPVLMLLSLPVLDYTWYILIKQTALDAAQAGAREGARVKASDYDPAVVAKTSSRAVVDATMSVPMAAQTIVTSSVIDAGTYSKVRVDVSLPFSPLAGFIDMPPFISASHQLRLERP